MAKRPSAGGGKPPRAIGNPPRAGKQPKLTAINVGGKKVVAKVTGSGARGVGLGLHGKGRSIIKKGYTGKGAYGYGQGNHGVGKPPTGAGKQAKMVIPHSKPAAHRAGSTRRVGGM